MTQPNPASVLQAEHTATSPKKPSGYLFLPRKFRRAGFLKWLRRTHAWLGLWGAVLGLLFGITGILLNHRTVMQIPAAKNAETQFQLALAGPLPRDPQSLAHYLQRELGLDRPPTLTRVDPARSAPWGEGHVWQPARWQISFVMPKDTVTAEYWVGNRHVSVRRLNPNFLAWLNRLHMATGATAGWILLADTLAAGLIVLAVTGFLLWTRLHGPRLLAAGLAGLCLMLAAGFALAGV